MAETDIRSSENKSIFHIKKRNGKIVHFEQSKISNAIYKALVAAGKSDRKLSELLATKLINKIDKSGYLGSAGKDHVLSVEDVQDMVESILIEEGLAETAKAYILYRHERRKIREMKMKILNKKDLDEVDKSLDINSLRVLSSRYLLRDNNNEITEGPKQLFERVAILVVIPDIIHDSSIFDLNGNHKQSLIDAEKYYEKLDDFDNKLKIGNYYFNKFHFESLIRTYINESKIGRMKASFKELLRMIAEGKMSSYSN